MDAVRLVRVDAAHIPVLSNLVQLYLHDFSIYLCDEASGQLDEAGRFDPGFDEERYTAAHETGRPRFWGYLARVANRWAGFALVSDRVDKAHHAGPGCNMDEFFVLRCWRRQGVGRAMARQVFERHPGYWQITEIGPNTLAQAFWQAVVREHTGGRAREFTTEEEGETVVWQVFWSS